MCQRLRQNCLLRPGDLRPLQEDLEILGVFNPGAVATAEGVVLLVRVAEAFRERRQGWTPLPRWDLAAERVVADWIRDDKLVFLDPRVVLIKQTGLRRLTFTSHLRVVRSRDGLQLDTIEPEIFRPSHENEEYGVEDPRITPLEGRFYFTYVAVSRHGAATALASTTDFKSFARHGIIFPPENK